MSHIKLLYHIVIRTKYSAWAINEEHETDLYKYMNAIAKARKSLVYCINGMPDHVHILISISPEIAISEFMMVLKSETSKWMKKSGFFPNFVGWGNGYAAFSYNESRKHIVARYIANQKPHHRRQSFKDEFVQEMRRHGLDPTTDLFFKDD